MLVCSDASEESAPQLQGSFPDLRPVYKTGQASGSEPVAAGAEFLSEKAYARVIQSKQRAMSAFNDLVDRGEVDLADYG